MTKVKVDGNEYPALIEGKVRNSSWDNRETKTITLEMSYEDVIV